MKNIKTLALQAKNRLRGRCEEKPSKSPKLRLIKGAEQVKIICKEEEVEAFFVKHKDIITAECLHNPISYIMDKKAYNKMCPMQREQYFFDTLEKYRMLKERWENEHNRNMDLFA